VSSLEWDELDESLIAAFLGVLRLAPSDPGTVATFGSRKLHPGAPGRLVGSRFPDRWSLPVAFLSLVSCSARIAVLTRRRVLDDQLAAGADPRSDPALRMRAAQLCRGRVRRGIARQLRGKVAAAAKGSTDRFGSGALARSEVLAEADALMDLVHRLEALRPVEAMGVALAKQLASDANSPLAVGAEPGTLHMVVRLATVALDLTPGHGAPASEP
jgi:hypothetical protein